jgi:phosphoglucomutase
MNIYTVGRATQGIANYILKSGADPSKGVANAYDCRYHSKEFAELAAQILAGNGITVYLFPSLRPTPELSFTIRSFAALGGINLTASHNPKEYNGYKVYWMDGAQISGEVSDGMLREILALDLFDSFKQMPLEDAIDERKVRMLGEEMDLAYLDYVMSMRQREDEELDLTIPIVYTPLNGAGSVPMQQLAAVLGYENFAIVPEQKDPDPEFTTVGYPNPEDPKAFALAEELGRKVGAEVLIATDPDSDRMAVEIADGKGGYTALNGNQTGALLIAYMAQSMKEKGKLP